MAFLGVPYRILYEAARLEAGLIGVQVRILRPGGVVVDGPFPMTELPAPFNGRYIYDYANSNAFPEGDYFAFISSPMDATFTTFRFELYHPWATAVDAADIATDVAAILAQLLAGPGNGSGGGVVGILDHTELTGFVETGESVVGSVLEADLTGLLEAPSISAEVETNDPLTGIIDNNL